MTEEEILASGRAAFDATYNGVIPAMGNVPPGSYGELNLKMFHEIWADDGISRRDKRLAVFGVMAGRGSDPSLFAIHVRSALRNKEFTALELRGFMRLFLYYGGVTSASTLYVTLEQILKETDEGRTA